MRVDVAAHQPTEHLARAIGDITGQAGPPQAGHSTGTAVALIGCQSRKGPQSLQA